MQRTPLGPRDLSRQYNKELTPYLRGSITTWSAVGLGPHAIAAKTFTTPSTVKSTLLREPLRIEGKTRSRSGRPPILSSIDKCHILRIIRRNPKLFYKDITE
jgi:hypothetical protein